MVKIRLTQTGSKNRKTYRVIVIEDSARRDGRAIETVGTYNPLVEPISLVLDKERIHYWVSQGAIMTDAVVKLMEGHEKRA